jgi:hypothetical protein
LDIQYPDTAPSAAVLFLPGFGHGEQDWLACAQWTPSFTGFGSAQCSLTFYESPAVEQPPQGRGWSLNAVQPGNGKSKLAKPSATAQEMSDAR